MAGPNHPLAKIGRGWPGLADRPPNSSCRRENLAVADGKAGNLAVDGIPSTKPGNLVADGNLASTGKTTGKAAGANVGDAYPPPEPRSRSPVISHVIFDSKILTGGGSPVASWSQAAAMALVDAWAFHHNWEVVAASVSAVHLAMTVKQCKRRMGTLKKIYNLFADDGGHRFLAKLHSILGCTDAVPQLPATIPTKAQSERHNVEKSSEDR